MTPTQISLMIGYPDPATLTTPELQASIRRVSESDQFYRALQYAPDHGAPALVDFLARRRNVSPENVMLVAGSTHAVDMITRLFAGAGCTVLVEAPTYADALHIFRDHRVNLCPIPVDDQGLIVSALAEQLEQLQAPAFLYTIPTFQNPSGATLSLERRQQIIELARQHNFLIVEDDVYRDLAFTDNVPDSFYTLAKGQGVISIGSFSKTLAPGLRLGWIVAAPELIDQCTGCGTTQMGGGASPISAQVVSDFCAQGHYETHILSLRENYRIRRDVLLAALEKYMPPAVHWTKPDGGFFVWLKLPVRGQDVKRAALERDVSLSAGDGYFVDPRMGAQAVRLTYSFAPLTDLEKGVQIIGEAIRDLMP